MEVPKVKRPSAASRAAIASIAALCLTSCAAVSGWLGGGTGGGAVSQPPLQLVEVFEQLEDRELIQRARQRSFEFSQKALDPSRVCWEEDLSRERCEALMEVYREHQIEEWTRLVREDELEAFIKSIRAYRKGLR